MYKYNSVLVRSGPFWSDPVNHRNWNFYICIFIYDLFLYYRYVVYIVYILDLHTYNIEINQK